MRSHKLIDDASYNPEVTRIDCEEAIVSVQIATGILLVMSIILVV